MVAREIEPAESGSARRCPDHDFALVVGVDHYPLHRSLQGAIVDARKFHAWVCEPGGGGVIAEHARLITSTEKPAAPIQDQIDDALLELIQVADQLGGGRRLYFYFSGHGTTSHGESPENVALLLANWSKNLARRALSSEQYTANLCNLGVFEELAIFLDCCRSTAERAVGWPPAVTYAIQSLRRQTRCFIAYATEAERSAFEIPVNDGWAGVFTSRLLQILRRSPGGVAANALKDQLEREIRETSRDQQAHIVNGLREAATFGMRGVLPILHVTFTVARRKVRLLDGSGGLVGEHEVTSERWRVPLRAGLYKLIDDTPASVLIDHGLGEATHVEF